MNFFFEKNSIKIAKKHKLEFFTTLFKVTKKTHFIKSWLGPIQKKKKVPCVDRPKILQ